METVICPQCHRTNTSATILYHCQDCGHRLVDKNMGLFTAAQSGQVNRLKNLLDDGADVSIRHNLWAGATPLHTAVSYNDDAYHPETRFSPRMTELLISYGADVNARDDYGNTPLHRAVLHTDQGSRKNDPNATGLILIEMLISHGADVNVKNNAGETPLHVAAKFGRSEEAKILMAHGANVTAKDERGSTPLSVVQKTWSTSSSYGTVTYKDETPSVIRKEVWKKRLNPFRWGR